MLQIVYTSFIVLAEHENRNCGRSFWNFVAIYSMEALFHIYFRLLAAIFDMRITQTFYGFIIGNVMLLDQKLRAWSLESRCYFV